MFEAMELDKNETPDLDTFYKFEGDTETIPRVPLDKQYPDHNSKWYHTRQKNSWATEGARYIAARIKVIFKLINNSTTTTKEKNGCH